jgi:AraC-like DNA-binding protein
MYFFFSFYSSFLLIFFIHGLVYALLLLKKSIQLESEPEKWLSAFLLLCILYIAPWMLGFAGWYDKQPYRDFIFYMPFQHQLFIGPVIFFYVQSLLNPSFTFTKKQWLHLLPGILYIVYNIVIVITDKLVLKRYYFLADGMDREFDSWYQHAGFISMVIYFYLSLRYYQLYKKLIVQVISYADVVLFKWVNNFILAFLAMLVLRVLFFIGGFIPAFAKLDYIGPWWEFFTFSIIFYYIAVTGYANSVQTKVPFKLNLLGNKPRLLLQSNNNEIENNIAVQDIEIIEFEPTPVNVENTPTENGLLNEWQPKIIQLVEVEKVFQDPELSLAQLAKLLKTNPSIISKVINQGFQLNFNDFINNYRIKAVQEKLLAGELSMQTMLGIAYDCGFNSKATFNRAFKKSTGLSPKDWIDKQ